MNFSEYQQFTNETAVYPQSEEDFDRIFKFDLEHWASMAYPIGKLNGEAGELAELHFKAFRDDRCLISDERRQAMVKELGDVLYYVARIAIHLGVSLDDIASDNMQKLRDRKARGVLQGSGDNR